MNKDIEKVKEILNSRYSIEGIDREGYHKKIARQIVEEIKPPDEEICGLCGKPASHEWHTIKGECWKPDGSVWEGFNFEEEKEDNSVSEFIVSTVTTPELREAPLVTWEELKCQKEEFLGTFIELLEAQRDADHKYYSTLIQPLIDQAKHNSHNEGWRS